MELNNYQCRAIAVLVNLQEIYLIKFLETWKIAKKKNIKLPETSDPDYESMETLLFHIFNSSRNYILWIVKHLGLIDPGIKEVPASGELTPLIKEYSEHLLDKWKDPLKNSKEEVLDQVFKSNRGVDFSIEAMLEHAVMHPLRHEYQLKRLIEKNKIQ